MKKFILKCLLFLSILHVIDISAGKVFKMQDKVKSGTGYKVNYVMKKSEDDILILGSSRAVHHFNSKIFEDSLDLKTYNAAIDGHGIVLMKPMVEEYIKRHNPKLIIYELTDGFDYYENDNVKYMFYLKPYFENPSIKEHFQKIDKLEYLKMHSNSYRLNAYLLRLFIGTLRTEDNNLRGYLPNPGVMDYEPKKPAPIVNKEDSIKVTLLRELIQTLKNNRIKIIFTYSPVYSYSNKDKKLINLIKNEGEIVFDYSEDNNFKGNRKYFHDRTHLNDVGADTLTRDIISKIKRYNILSQ